MTGGGGCRSGAEHQCSGRGNQNERFKCAIMGHAFLIAKAAVAPSIFFQLVEVLAQ